MARKLVVMREESGRMHFGDVVSDYPAEMYLGDMVEPKGGPFSIITITDAKEGDQYIDALTQPWFVDDEEHPAHDRQFYLKPLADDPILAELVQTGHASGTMADLTKRMAQRG